MKPRLRLEEVSDPRVLRAMDAVPREQFVPPELRDAAYDDRALPIACGQTISQPAVVAYMTEQLRLTPGSRVLEIGTGSGYQTAILAEIVREVFSVERLAELAATAAARLARLGYANVRVRTGDGTRGWPEAAPFDAILVAAAAAVVPPALPAQLAVRGGRLIMPVGGPNEPQTLVLFERRSPEEIVRTALWPVRFVPLIPG
jgi:protein-L-isoaspartate(D-aspartate) O-methyltransferase